MPNGRKKRAANYADSRRQNSVLCALGAANRRGMRSRPCWNLSRAITKARTMNAVSTQPKTGSRDMTFRPKYITFDCYGTLTNFRMQDVAREMYAERVPAARGCIPEGFRALPARRGHGRLEALTTLEAAPSAAPAAAQGRIPRGEGPQLHDAVHLGPHADDVPEPLSRIAKRSRW
jgi:hypothetical protein